MSFWSPRVLRSPSFPLLSLRHEQRKYPKINLQLALPALAVHSPLPYLDRGADFRLAYPQSQHNKAQGYIILAPPPYYVLTYAYAPALSSAGQGKV